MSERDPLYLSCRLAKNSCAAVCGVPSQGWWARARGGDGGGLHVAGRPLYIGSRMVVIGCG